MKTINVTIKGITPLLQHRWNEGGEDDIGKGTRRVHVQDTDRRDVAERHAYRHADGYLYIPGAAFARAIREAGGGHKQRGSRKSLKYVIPAAVRIVDDVVPLLNGDGKTRCTEFEIDSRPVVIPSTKGRVMRHRPRVDRWHAKFKIAVNESMIDASVVHRLLTEAGDAIGIGDFRPEKGGSFGAFQVVAWE